MPETKISQIGCDYVNFNTESLTVDVKDYGVKKILFSWRDLDKLLQSYATELFQNLMNIRKLEILLGGDHGKGALNFLAVVIVQYNDAESEPKIIELQIYQLDHAKDTIHLLKHLVNKITPGIVRLEPTDGKSTVYVCEENGGIYQICGNVAGAIPVHLEFFLIGDLKFLFMMLGCDGYAGSQCLYCKLLAKDCKEKQREGLVRCGGELWTMENFCLHF